MPNPSDDPGLLSSVGSWLSLPGYSVRNAIRGNFTGAGRNLVDFLGDAVDAPLPGDWIPHLSTPADKPEFSDVIGGMSPGIVKSGVDLLGNVATDPLSYVPGSVVAKGLGAASKGIGAGVKALGTVAPGAETALRQGYLGTKSALGWLKPATPGLEDILTGAEQAGQRVSNAGLDATKSLYADTPEDVRKGLFQALNNYQGVPGAATKLDPTFNAASPTFGDLPAQEAQLAKHVSALNVPPETQQAILDLGKKRLPLTMNQWEEGTKDFPIFTPNGGEGQAPMLYGQRQFSPVLTPEMSALLGEGDRAVAAKATKGRTLEQGDLADYLNQPPQLGPGGSPNPTLEEDIAKADIARAQQQGRMATRAQFGSDLVKHFGAANDKFVSLADEESRGAVSRILDDFKQGDPEGYLLAKNLWEGQGPRGPILEALANANKLFKPAAVYGVFFPRVGGIMKNILSFPAQYGLQGEGKLAGAQLARTPATIYSAMRAGVQKAFGMQMPSTELDQSLDLMEQAVKASGGRSANAIAALQAQGRPDLALAMQHGVADGFVSRESVEDSISKSTWGHKILASMGMGTKSQDKIFDMADAPAAAFQGAEQTARLGGFLDAYKARIAQGLPPDEAAAKAAQIVQDSLYDYGIKTGANRTLRTLIPFAAFQTNAIRQSAQFVAKHPAAAVALGEGMKDKQDSPIYNYMQGKTNVPLGLDEKGNPSYISSLGLPFESLAQIPNPSANLLDFGRDVEQNLIGSSHPLLKTAYSAISGRDPTFQSQYGSYDRVPLIGSAGTAGRIYNQVAGTGLLQPVLNPLAQAQHLTDERHSLPVRLLNFLTGANVVSVDPAIAEQQQLADSLRTDPSVMKFTRYVPATGDTDAKELIKHLGQVNKKVSDQRKAQAPIQ